MRTLYRRSSSWWLLLGSMASLATFPASARLADSSVPVAESGSVIHDVRVAMPDGVHLVGDVYLPSAKGRFPLILTVTPYSRKQNAYEGGGRRAAQWTDNGFAYAIFDTRGNGDSEGAFDWFRSDVDDNPVLIQWLAGQSWSTGKVGMVGSSYTGTNQWHAAMRQPPALKCIAPNAVVGRPMEELPRNGGAFKLRWALAWAHSLSQAGRLPTFDFDALLNHRPLSTIDEVALGKELPLLRHFIEHDTLDEYWRKIHYVEADFRRLAIPSLAVSGWFDGTLPGTLWYYRNMKRYSPADDRQYLVIGPWEHMSLSDGGRDGKGNPVTRVGEVDIPPQGFLDLKTEKLAFFDWCLKDGPDFKQPSARIFVTGSNRWLSLPEYPPRTDLRPLYLHSGGRANGYAGDGRLSWTVPGTENTDRFTYNPRNPVQEWVVADQDYGVNGKKGQRINLQSMPINLNQVADRPDVLVYRSEPLEEPLTVIGNVTLTLFAASSAVDTDFTSHIAEVRPDGRAIKLGPQSGGIIRARYRNGYDKAELLTPGAPAQFKIDYFDIGHTFMPGTRIQVSITSSNYPWINANPNTGKPLATDTDPPIVARQTVFHDAVRPSQLLLPVFTDWPGDGKADQPIR